MKNATVCLTLLAAVSAATFSACSESSNTARGPMKGVTPPVASVVGASADGTAAPSVPSATEVLKTEALKTDAPSVAPGSLPTKTAGGTDDMKKSLTKSTEDTQMPMVGHGNNHSAPDKNAAEAAKLKP